MRRKPNDRLFNARLARGWSLEEAANRSGVSAKRLNRIEFGTGLAMSDEKEKICAAFDLDAETLGFLKESKKRQARRAEFLREKRKNASQTEKILQAAPTDSTIVINIRDRTGGRARKVRRG